MTSRGEQIEAALATVRESGDRPGRFVVDGAARSGKTAVQIGRALDVARSGGEAVIVAAPGARAVVADALVDVDPENAVRVRVVTWFGLARALVREGDPSMGVLRGTSRQALVGALLGADRDSLAVRAALRRLDRGRTVGVDGFEARYATALEERRCVDVRGLFARATALCGDGRAIAPARLLCVDDEAAIDDSTLDFASAVVRSHDGTAIIARNPSGPRWRRDPDPVAWTSLLDGAVRVHLDAVAADPIVEAIHVRHRSLLGRAVVGEIQALTQSGCPTDQIAVVATGPDVGAIAGAAAAGGVRLDGVRRRCGDHPVVSHIADLVRDVAPADRAAAAFAAWESLAVTVIGDATAGPTVAAFIDALGLANSDADPDADVAHALDAAVVLRDRGGVEIVSDAATIGRSWRAVIVTGCEEGRRPLAPSTDPDEHVEVAESRRRFDDLTARADERVIAVAAPAPGVLVSRFIEGRPRRAPHAIERDRRTLPVVAETVSTRPFWGPKVRASASSLETFRNCPLQFTIRYVIGVDTPSGVQAGVGTLVHAILEEFLDPTSEEPKTLTRLAGLIDAHWDDNLFTYRAQAAEFRGRVERMLLEVWFPTEGQRTANVALLEHPFEIEVAGHTIRGLIDRIDRSPNEAGPDGIEIIDYKTGASKSSRAGEESLQLGTYYLAALRDPVVAAIGAPERLRLHFVAEGKDADQAIASGHEARWEWLLGDALEGIVAEQHEPSTDADCEYCDYQSICPIQREGRLVALRPKAAR